ncbi:hypothetical protein POM88_027047 [Heracleum sosnowskyi]|uniref:Uncharacterized protein n=1 Tax=Heracleum sosnowskyi TaxID=360622 RepID=A0AAD8I7R0_9APIA|nr:hypothetical protein POM88_027047 [Heracleum sosnowskyi]
MIYRVLGNYGKRKERFREGIFSGQSSKSTATDNKLTIEEIMRMAAERFIHFSNKELDGITSFIHPHGTCLSSLSSEDTRMVDLAHLLLASAEKVGNKQFDAAHKLLVATEEEDIITRSVNIDVWRVFFQSLRMVEIDISKSSLDQANLVLEQKFSCEKSCTIYKNGKCLFVGWYILMLLPSIE